MSDFEVTIGTGPDAVVATTGSGRPDEGLDPDPAGKVSGSDLGSVEWDGKTWPVIRTPTALTEEQYVAAEVQLAKDLIERGLKDPDGKRVRRARSYARWRYRGYLAGEIRSL